MKSTQRLLAASLALTASVILAPAANASCSNATLKGNYGFTFSGFGYSTNNTGLGYGAIAGAGLGTFDGKGNVSASFDYSVGGFPQGTMPGSHPFGTPYTATYVVYPDCSGVLTGEFGADNFTFVIVAGGMEILAVDISGDPNVGGNNTITVDFKKVSSSD
jgi:hypothetical protein